MPWEASGAWVFEKPSLPFTPFCFASFPALQRRSGGRGYPLAVDPKRPCRCWCRWQK